MPVNFKFIIEGMEEAGSLGLEKLLQEEKQCFLSDVDYVVISDSLWLSNKQPALTYGTRGNACFFVEVKETGSFELSPWAESSDVMYLQSHLHLHDECTTERELNIWKYRAFFYTVFGLCRFPSSFQFNSNCLFLLNPFPILLLSCHSPRLFSSLPLYINSVLLQLRAYTPWLSLQNHFFCCSALLQKTLLSDMCLPKGGLILVRSLGLKATKNFCNHCQKQVTVDCSIFSSQHELLWNEEQNFLIWKLPDEA